MTNHDTDDDTSMYQYVARSREIIMGLPDGDEPTIVFAGGSGIKVPAKQVQATAILVSQPQYIPRASAC